MKQKMKYGRGLQGYLRIGDYMCKHDGGYVQYLYRIDNPTKRLYPRPGTELTVKAAQIRETRHKLENVIG